MTDRGGLPSSKSTIRATGSVLNLLPQVAGFAVGFSGLAYISGWREASAYYQELGAPWAMALLTASQIMQTSIWLISLISIIVLLSVLSLVQGAASQKGLRLWSIIFLVLAGAAYVLPLALDGRVDASSLSLFAGLTSIFWAVSAGLTIGELIACLALQNLEWGEYQVFLLYFVILYGLLQAPTNMGNARAQLAEDLNSSSLPKVLFTTNQTGDWRLVGPCGDKLLLVSLAAQRHQRWFKLTDTVSISEIDAH